MNSVRVGPDGRLWMHEHGPMGGDEINRPGPGENFGWPLVSFGLNYNGTAVGEAIASGKRVILDPHREPLPVHRCCRTQG